MTETRSVMCAGSYRLARITSARKWYHVDFGIGVGVKVNPKARFQGCGVRGNSHLIALKAAECIESLSVRRLKPVFDTINATGGSTEEIKWMESKKQQKPVG